jgi:hypothetical protein
MSSACDETWRFSARARHASGEGGRPAGGRRVAGKNLRALAGRSPRPVLGSGPGGAPSSDTIKITVGMLTD